MRKRITEQKSFKFHVELAWKEGFEHGKKAAFHEAFPHYTPSIYYKKIYGTRDKEIVNARNA